MAARLLLALVSGVAAVRRIIDTHVHNADLDLGLAYTFPTSFPDLNRSWSMADYDEATLSTRTRGAALEVVLMTLEKKVNTRAAIFAEAALYQRTMDAHDAVVGFVGGVDLLATSDATAALKSHFPGLRGVRQGLWHEAPAFFRDARVVAAVRNLSALALPFDALVKAPQLPDLAALARAAPATTINLNHVGYPPFGNASAMAAWERDLRALAALPNVYCKLSGLPQAFGRPGWAAADFVSAVRAAARAGVAAAATPARRRKKPSSIGRRVLAAAAQLRRQLVRPRGGRVGAAGGRGHVRLRRRFFFRRRRRTPPGAGTARCSTRSTARSTRSASTARTGTSSTREAPPRSTASRGRRPCASGGRAG